MKTRTGFVSNSSTSSFVIAGVLLDAKTNSRLDVLKRLYPDEVPPAEDEDALFDWEHDMAHHYNDVWVNTANGDNSLPKGKTFAGVLVDQQCREDGHNDKVGLLSDLEARVETIRIKLGLNKEKYPTMLISGTEVS